MLKVEPVELVDNEQFQECHIILDGAVYRATLCRHTITITTKTFVRNHTTHSVQSAAQ